MTRRPRQGAGLRQGLRARWLRLAHRRPVRGHLQGCAPGGRGQGRVSSAHLDQLCGRPDQRRSCVKARQTLKL